MLCDKMQCDMMWNISDNCKFFESRIRRSRNQSFNEIFFVFCYSEYHIYLIILVLTMKKARNILSELLIFVWCYFTTSKSSFFPTNFGSLFSPFLSLKNNWSSFWHKIVVFYSLPGLVNLLADISKESKMREHFTKKGPLTLTLIG